MSETLGLMLVRADKITRAQLYDALREQRATGARLGDILFQKGWIGEDELAMIVAKQLDIDFVETSFLEKVPKNLTEKFPRAVALEFRCVPVRFWNKKMTVAIDDQKTRNYMDEIGYLTGMTCIPAMAAPTAIRAAVKRLYDADLPPPRPSPLAARAAAAKKKTAAPIPLDARDRPTETLEALPVTRTDEKGREVASVRKATGEEEVFLLTEVAKTAAVPDLVRIAEQGELTPVAETDVTAPKMKAVPKPSAVDAPEWKPPAPEAKPAPVAKPPKPATDEERHDGFLAPDAGDDDRPVWKPKVVTGAEVKKKAEPPPPVPPPREERSGEDFDIVRAAERVFEAQTPQEVARVIVNFARNLVDRAIFFDVSGAGYAVLARAGSGTEDDRAGELTASQEDLVLLGVIAQTKMPAYGPTPEGDMYERFFDTVGFMKPPYILLYPLVVGGSTRAVLFGGLGEMRPPEEFGDLQLLFKEAATALEILAG